MGHRAAIAAALGAAAWARVAAAEPETCSATDAAALRAQLTAEAHRARVWNTGWGLGFAAASAGELGLAAAKWNPLGAYDRDYRDTLYSGAGKAAIGALARVVTPLHVDVPAEVADPCADLAQLRAALARAGKLERALFWTSHLGGAAVNLGGFLILEHQTSLSTALVGFAIGYPVGLLSTYTMPRGAWHAWRDLAVVPAPLPGGGAVLTVGGAF